MMIIIILVDDTFLTRMKIFFLSCILSVLGFFFLLVSCDPSNVYIDGIIPTRSRVSKRITIIIGNDEKKERC